VNRNDPTGLDSLICQGGRGCSSVKDGDSTSGTFDTATYNGSTFLTEVTNRETVTVDGGWVDSLNSGAQAIIDMVGSGMNLTDFVFGTNPSLFVYYDLPAPGTNGYVAGVASISLNGWSFEVIPNVGWGGDSGDPDSGVIQGGAALPFPPDGNSMGVGFFQVPGEPFGIYLDTNGGVGAFFGIGESFGAGVCFCGGSGQDFTSGGNYSVGNSPVDGIDQ
jgi:hypothetical protein